MRLNIKNCKIKKIDKHFKASNFFFLINGMNQNFLDWLLIEQRLKRIGFNCNTFLNKITLKALKDSNFGAIESAINSFTCTLETKPDKRFLKLAVINTFNSLFFELLIIKLNGRTYPAVSSKNTRLLKYKKTKLLFYQFNLTHLKIYSKISK